MARPDLRFVRLCVFVTLAVTLAVQAFGRDQDDAQATTLELVQTTPVETELGLPGLREAHEVWPERIAGATRSLDLAHFYASNAEGSRLEPVLAALEAAVGRGVRLRFLADARFQQTYPDTLARIDAWEGAEVRIYDLGALGGGVLHAKWMLIDGREGFVGSQNFDWRALEHIQELGLRFTGPELCAAFGELFELDWRQAADESTPVTWGAEGELAFPVTAVDGTRVTPVFSPQGMLPRPELWDLPRLVRAIEDARRSVRLQLLNYRSVGYDRTYWDGLETPLRAAAARGVSVEILCSHWATAAGTIEGLKSLQALRNVEVRILTVPPLASGEFIPFGRVAHAKLMVVDGRTGWVGTSNGSRDYFHASRNVGLFLEGGPIATQLESYFAVGWASEHAETLDLGRDYPPPRRER